MNFSDPYFPADQSVTVKRGSDIKTVADLDGKTIGAQRGTAGAAYARDEVDAGTVRPYDLIDDAFKALQAGQVEAVIYDFAVSRDGSMLAFARGPRTLDAQLFTGFAGAGTKNR